jgi:hypothetical protein
MLQRVLPAGFCFAGLALLAVTGVAYWTREAEESVAFEEMDAEVQVGGPNEEKAVVFWVRNPTRRPVRIIGLAPC